ncbi:MAG: D-lyxose/D-mannose family sugar isomerase [Acholeplasmataceae bacterium]
MKRSEKRAYQIIASQKLADQGIVLTEEEKESIEIADFNLDDFEVTGLSIVTYVNTERVCAKELVMLPKQTCPEHLHEEKEETFRCRQGKVFLYVEGPGTRKDIQATVPPGVYRVFHEIELNPGEQYTLHPNTWHWFQAGKEGAIISEFSTRSTDEKDIFRDPDIVRMPPEEVL